MLCQSVFLSLPPEPSAPPCPHFSAKLTLHRHSFFCIFLELSLISVSAGVCDVYKHSTANLKNM